MGLTAAWSGDVSILEISVVRYCEIPCSITLYSELTRCSHTGSTIVTDSTCSRRPPTASCKTPKWVHGAWISDVRVPHGALDVESHNPPFNSCGNGTSWGV